MTTNSTIRKAVRLALASSAAATAMYGVAAVAQDTAPQDDAADVGTIVVTGSRISTDPNLVTSSPVTTVRSEDITHRGVTRIEDLVNDLPQVVPELTANDSNGATGTATLDLRGLGSDRTLTLTNGHRMGFGDPFALAPDVNQVPSALIERIEGRTGGASSTYGSDAVSGVVNFIMKQDFEGFQINYQYSGYQHEQGNAAVQSAISAEGFEQAPSNVTDGATMSIDLLIGMNSADGRGNVTAYLGYRDINAILESERDFSACALSASNGKTCSGSATSAEGLFTPFDGVNYFTVEGDQFVPGIPYYNYGPLNYFQRPDERYTAGVFGHYEVSEHFEGYTEVQVMDDRSLAQIAPSGAFFVTSQLNCSNPFLSAQQFATLGCTSPADVVPWYVGRRNVEGGPRFDDLRHTSYRLLGGMRGAITENWDYDVFANFARLVYSEVYNNDMSITRIIRALDVVDDGTGNAVCQSVLDGTDPACVPWNIFQEGQVTPEAINYLTLPLFSDGDLNQDQFVGFVRGDLGFGMPTANSTVQVVIGAEYRDESFDYNPDQGFTSGDGAGQGGPTAAVAGSVNVTEYFAEVRVPLVEEKPGFQNLALDLRYRNSDYSTGVTADTYNAGLEWSPIQGVMLRGGVSRAVRAGNIRELFEPQNVGLWGGVDPCGGATPEFTLEQCQRTGVTPAQYGAVPLSPAGQYNGLFGGNPQLEPEEADSITLGIVLTPDLLPGFSFSVDYWNVEVTDAIDIVDPEFIVNQCGLTGDASLCSLITRNPVNGNLWVNPANAIVQSTQVNIGFFDAAGVDIFARYRWDLGAHALDFNLRASFLEKFDQQLVPGAAIDDCVGKWGGSCERPTPEYKHIFNTVWMTPWDLTVVGAWRFVGGVDEFFPEGTAPSVNAFNAGDEQYIDLSVSWRTEFLSGETELTAGVTNLTDNDPPVNGRFGNVSVYGNGNTIPGTWDAMGRYYFIGLTQRW
jgi:outer membrane receptor protein involved in Fe transport